MMPFAYDFTTAAGRSPVWQRCAPWQPDTAAKTGATFKYVPVDEHGT